MKNNIILFTLTFISVFAFGQKPKPLETTKPFVLGVIDEIQSKELAAGPFALPPQHLCHATYCFPD